MHARVCVCAWSQFSDTKLRPHARKKIISYFHCLNLIFLITTILRSAFQILCEAVIILYIVFLCIFRYERGQLIENLSTIIQHSYIPAMLRTLIITWSSTFCTHGVAALVAFTSVSSFYRLVEDQLDKVSLGVWIMPTARINYIIRAHQPRDP